MTTFDENYRKALRAAARKIDAGDKPATLAAASTAPISDLANHIRSAADTAHREHRPLIIESPKGSGAYSTIHQWARENVLVVRAPHHTISSAGMQGTRARTVESVRRVAGKPVESHVVPARPGEWDLAAEKEGMLILDDAAEFRSSVIEALTERARLAPTAVFVVALITTPYPPYMQKPVDRLKHLLGKYVGKPLVVSV